jgi:hypothetical protein
VTSRSRKRVQPRRCCSASGAGSPACTALTVAADPDDAWRVLGDLAVVDGWILGITKVELDGMTRVCTFADGHT